MNINIEVIKRKMNIGNMNKEHVSLLIIALIFIAGICFKFLYLPKIKHISRIRRDFRDVTLEVKTIKHLIRRGRDYGEIKEKLVLLKDRFPKEDEIDEVLQYLTKTAQETGVSLVSINAKPTIQQKLYNEIPIEIRFQGEYYNIVDYLDRLGSCPKIVDIDRIQIIKDEIIFPNLNAELSVMTYILQER